MVSARVFITAEHPDYSVLLDLVNGLTTVKAGRRLKQVRVSDTERVPNSIGDLVDSVTINKHWRYKEKVFVFQTHLVIDFDVPEAGVWYIKPIINQLLGGWLAKAGVEAATFSFSLFGMSEDRKREVLERCFPQPEEQDEP